MKAFLVMGLALLSGACTIENAGDGDGDGDDDDDIECSPSDRVGTYLVETTERDGTCGAIPSQVGRIDDATALPAACVLDAADRWSDGDCTLERAYTCTDTANDLVTSWTAITTQRDSDGELITGLVTVRGTQLDGTFICSSTYDFRAERQ